MRVPTRRSDKFKKRDDGPVYLTQRAVDRLEKTLARIQSELPSAIAEVERTKEYGDFSENEEYKAAKRKMRGMHSRVAIIKSRLARAVIIDESENTSGVVKLGSTVTLVADDGAKKQYQILGPHESDPANGKISFESPLGSSLIGKQEGDSISIGINGKKYGIIKVK